MKRTILLKFTVAIIAICFLTAPLYSQDTLQLSIKEALQIALSENLTVKIADKEIAKTKYVEKGMYGSLFPQIDFSGNYQRTIKKQTMYMEDQEIKFGLDNTWSTGFSLGMPLISAPLWKSLKISAMDVELSIEKARGSRIDLIDQVQQCFYSALLATDSYAVYKENYDNAVRSYNDVKKKYESGKTSKYDLIRAQVTMQNAEPGMYDAQNYIVLIQWKLKALIGIDLKTNIKCIGQLSDFQNVLANIPNGDTTLLNNNTQLKQLAMQMNILDQTYKMQLAKYYPTLNLSLSWQWSAMTNNFKFSTFKWNPYAIGGVSLVIPIFSGGQRYHTLKQTRVQQEQLEMQKENVKRDLEVSIKQTLSSMETCVKQYNAAQMSIEGAQTGYSISLKRYEIGSGTLLELDASRLALLQARLNLNQSVYNFLVAKSSLEKIFGESINKQ
ncbi:MAG: TolC family protein [Bacteroidales bacterium]